MTIHLVYPHKKIETAPNVIGYRLLEFLGKFEHTIAHNYDEVFKINPKEGDVIIGHPHPASYTVFRRSIKNKGWRRKIMLSPFNHDPRQVGFVDDFIDDVDLYLAITGNYWFKRIKGSQYDRWLPKMRHMDFAVDILSFEKIKIKFGPVGSRRFIYIGNDHPGKNLEFLSKLALACGIEITWAGKGRVYPGLKNIGYCDFQSKSGKKIILDHDFLITVGGYDANPTTILEALAWGLVPVCTVTSGYESFEEIINVSGNSIDEAAGLINQLQVIEPERLRMMSEKGRLLAAEFNWDVFHKKVYEAIYSNDSPMLAARSIFIKKNYIKSDLRLAKKIMTKNLKYLIRGAVDRVKNKN
jgi:glycosyltransferase involved in cell wall biosynthesis